MMTGELFWIVLVCFNMQRVVSETSEELLSALKQKFVQQPDCTPLFEIRHPGYISPNAEEYPEITTDDECRSSCIKDEDCMSYQIDSRKGKTFCRMQSSYSIEDLQGPFNAADVKEYVFTVKCINNTSGDECSPLIEIRLRNWNSHLGEEHLNVRSELECRAICFDDKDCMSYHIDTKPDQPLCYIQKHIEMFSKDLIYMGTEVMEYFIVDRCFDKYDVTTEKECSPTFKKSQKQASKEAKPYPFVTTEQLCRLTCLFAPECVSYQINRTPEAIFCSIQTDGGNLKEDEPSNMHDLVTEYILVDSCTDKPLDNSSPDCKPFTASKPYPGVSYDAEPHAEVEDSEDCKLLCLSTPTCVAFQVTSEGVLCWTQNDWTYLLPNNGYPNSHATETIVIRKCQSDESTAITEAPSGESSESSASSEGQITTTTESSASSESSEGQITTTTESSASSESSEGQITTTESSASPGSAASSEGHITTTESIEKEESTANDWSETTPTAEIDDSTPSVEGQMSTTE